MKTDVVFTDEIVCKCKNEKCGQEFNSAQVNLAVCMYGAMFLIRHESELEPEGKGYVGITCPVCLETSIYEHTAQEIRDAKAFLENDVKIIEIGTNEEGNVTHDPVTTFFPQLRYYSPFQLKNEATAGYDIVFYGTSEPERNANFENELYTYHTGRFHENDRYLCSYIHNEDPPKGQFCTIYWYRDEDLQALLDLEKKNDIRIFPRYYYATEVYDKIDPLLRFHYFQGKEYEQAKEDHVKGRENLLATLKQEARDKDKNYEKLLEETGLDQPDGTLDIIDRLQQQVKADPKVYGEYFDVLVSDPSPVGNYWSADLCNYLWTMLDFFKGRALPDCFVSTIDTDASDAGTMLEE